MVSFDRTVVLENETERTYVYGNSEVVVEAATELSWFLENPHEHYLKSKSGLFKILSGYNAIVISAPDWELQ